MAKTKEKPPAKAPKKPAKPAERPASNPVKAKSPAIPNCSFCGRPSEFIRRLIAGPNNVFICEECIEVCVAILLEENKDDWVSRLKNILSGKNKSLPDNENDNSLKKDN
jgi:hypothetical protein